MDKIEERRHLQQVFGAAADVAQDFEAPDFVLTAKGGTTLGVEVTAFYANNADAKLRKLADYASRLIDRQQKVHRADKELLKVEEAVIHDKDGNFKARVTGIFQEMPSVKDSVELLFAKIEEKEIKVSEYREHCDAVDLIIHDASRLFTHGSEEEFYRPFYAVAPRQVLAKTPFREIHLLTTTKDNKPIYIPLVANSFIADCFAYEHLLKPDIEAKKPATEIFQLLSACLHGQGHHQIRVLVEGDGVGYFCGAWEMYYSTEGKKIRDWMLHHDTYEGVPIAETISDLSPELQARAEALLALRTSCFSAVDVRLPAHDA